jgi:glucosamine-6-phosphate deaminase
MVSTTFIIRAAHSVFSLKFVTRLTRQDEYVGIPRDHPESYHTFMFKNLFSLIDIE